MEPDAVKRAEKLLKESDKSLRRATIAARFSIFFLVIAAVALAIKFFH